MSNVVLTYFPMPARAEGIKLALDLAGIPFTFKSVQNWPEEKAEGLKSGLLPFGQVPLLQIDGMNIVQSMAILNYISRKYLSKDMTDKNSVQVDILLNGWNDLLNKTFGAIFGPADKVDEFFEGEARNQLKMLENVYVSYGTPFMGDHKVSVADAHAYGTLKVMKSKKSDILNGFPHLMKWEETMNGLDGVKMYNERV
ncbi:hypothetical protein WA171_002361 [Blastocystis sp. BT1]